MTEVGGSFRVLGGSEEPFDALDGGIRLTHASGTQSFVGGIAGDGSIHWLMLYRGDGMAHLVGQQRITGTVDRRRGSFVLSAEGDHDGTGSRIHLRVIAGSGTGGLAGIAGEGTMLAPGGPDGTYAFDLRFGD